MKKVFLISTVLMSFLGCHNETQTKVQTLNLIADSQKIISTRSEMRPDDFFALIKLNKPSLLESSQRVNGRTVVDAALKLEIEKEQEQVIAKLQELSPKVRLIYRYKMVLNALAVVGPTEVFDQLAQFGLVASWEKSSDFDRPSPFEVEKSLDQTLDVVSKNSVKFIGAEEMHKQGISGQGIKIGVIDTGIDYTHKMLGGEGTAEAYKAIDPSASAAAFPNKKVVGGVDLVGTEYNPASPLYFQHIPKPDMNPLDEASHGTHVAGTIAGVGDNVGSYNGVAPEASLYAIKVFGANGSTNDMVVIAGLEYAADPNGDGTLDDQLDVVNLSLGSSFGTPKLLYSEALKNLVNGGTSAVISAGNSGNVDYIVGSPGTATEALSVAASVDDMDKNWKFNSSSLQLGTEKIYVEAVEAKTSQSTQTAPVGGTLLYIGLADKDLSAEVAGALAGKVAFIDRGVVSFDDKIQRAVDAGAIGVVVANNQPGEPGQMGTTIPFKIPAIMISLDVGNKIKEALYIDPGSVQIQFLGDKKIERPELIDSITSFSSKGPRSNDGFLKPEITAPGFKIISAAIGTGDKAVQMSGTSMAAPHMTGVMALLKQNYTARYLDLTPIELKNIAMSTAKSLLNKGVNYSVTRQGAGRVQVGSNMMNAKIVLDVPSLSFGELSVSRFSNLSKNIKIKNITQNDIELTAVFEGSPNVSFFSRQKMKILASSSEVFKLNFVLKTEGLSELQNNIEGFVKFLENGVEVYRIPLLAIVKIQSGLQFNSLNVSSTNDVSVDIQNTGIVPGQAMLFNFLSNDSRKLVPASAVNIMNNDCDLQSVSYRILKKENSDGVMKSFVQFALKIYKPMTSWNGCDMSILFDKEKDGIIDQELVGTQISEIKGLSGKDFASILLDAQLAKKIRKEYDDAVKAAGNDIVQIAMLASLENYSTAVLGASDARFMDATTVVVLESDLDLIQKDTNNNINFKVVSSNSQGNPFEVDDYVGTTANIENIFTVSADEKAQPYFGFVDDMKIDSASQVAPLTVKTFNLTKGSTPGSLAVLFPQNKFSLSDRKDDKQFVLVKSK